jgi:hypothetical protein
MNRECDLCAMPIAPGGALAAQVTFHKLYACPATATTYDGPAPMERSGRLKVHGSDDSYVARMARRANMHRLYPALVPAYTRPSADGRAWEPLALSVRSPGPCSCGASGRLYPSGVFCDAHRPGRAS